MSAPRAFPRRVDAVGAAVLVVLGAVWLSLRSHIARGAAGSPQALLIVAATGLLAVGIGYAAWRLTRRPLLARGLAVVPLMALFTWSEAVPLLGGEVVRDDPSPLVAGAPEVPADPGSIAPDVVATSGAPTPSSTTPPPSSAPPTPTLDPTPAAARVAAPVLLGDAPLVGINHDAEGTVQVIRDANDALVVRFEDFSVERGPDYLLYVLPEAEATSPDGGTSLGRFTATQGSVNVSVPGDFDASGPVTVLIWCRVYAVPVANAGVLG